jgi:DNA-binding CsgD family transcriptional regulator
MARMYVSLEKLQRSAQLIDALADIDQPGKLPEIVLPGVADLVGCDIVTYNEIPTAPGQAGYYLDYPNGCINPASLAAFEAHLQEHPLLKHYRAGGAGEPAKISDFLSQRRFHQLGLYSEFFRHIPVEYQIAFSLPDNQDGQLTAIALNRAGRDFSEDDRAVLTALSAPLGNALRRARDRHSAGAALATAGSGGLADLTDREIQVLQLAARGGTNLAIARTFDVSPRTVAKHLEHIYRKLGVTSRAAAVYRTTAMGQASGTLRLSPRQAVRRPIARAAGYSRVVSWRSMGTSLKAL